MGQLATFLSKSPIQYILLGLVAVLVVLWFVFRRVGKLKPYTGQLLILAGVFEMAALFTIITYSFPVARGTMASQTDASTIVRFWFILLIPITIMALVPMFKGSEEKDEPYGRIGLVGIVVAMLVVSLLLFDIIGYYLSSALFILGVMLILQQRSKVVLICVPVGWVVFTYAVFARLLYVPLPIGKLFSQLLG